MVGPFARLRPRAPLPASILAACALVSAAQQPPPKPPEDASESTLVLHATVHRVLVDVVVRDSHDQPVRGLSEKDLAISEDGKAQRILSFEEHDMDADTDAGPPPTSPLPANTFVNVPASPERGPLNVILYDMLDTAIDDQPFARLQMLKFVDAMPEGSRFAIFVLADGLHLAQGFTSDRDQLHAVLDARNRAHIPKIFLYADNYRQSISPLGALSDVARFLDGMPGRKNLIWLSDHFPVPFLPDFSNARDERVDTDARVRRVTNILAAGQIALYPVDVRGVAIGNLGGNNSALNGEYLAEDGLAEATGGRAYHSGNDLGSAIADAAENGARYYTLSYAPTNPKWDGRLRQIRVQLRTEAAHSGYRLAYRHSYFAFDDAPQPRESHPDPVIQELANRLEHGAPMAHELFMEVHVHKLDKPEAAVPSPNAPEPRRRHRPKALQAQTLAIDYRVNVDNGGPPNAPDLPAAPDLEFVAMAYDSAGRILNAIVQKSLHDGNSATASGWPPGWFRVRQQLEVPAQTAWIRVAARDLATNRVGALEVSLPLAPEPEPNAGPAAASLNQPAKSVAKP
jgi:VWFA-related protein